MSTAYDMFAVGRCMGRLVPDGTTVQADAAAEIQPGNIVAVVLDGDGPFHEMKGMLDANDTLGIIKLYLGTTDTATGREVFLLGQVNPPLVFAVPRASLRAMHRVTATVSAAPPTDEAPGNDAVFTQQMDLISPFFCESAPSAPVGPDWRPIDLDAFVKSQNMEQADA